MAIRTQEKPTTKRVAHMSDICSAEHYYDPDSGDLTRVLYDVSFDVHVGDAVGISAKEITEAKLLLEILANVRPYYSGKCVLSEFGMMQKKRVILPHLFYIDTPDMLYENMTVLDCLLFAASPSAKSEESQTRQMTDLLKDFRLDLLSDNIIASLDATDKFLIELVAAACSDSELVILNVLDYVFSDRQIASIEKICSYMRQEKGVVIGTMQAKLIGMCCNKVGYILDGTLQYYGFVDNLCQTWDKVLYLISDKNPKQVADKLKHAYDNYIYVTMDNANGVLVYNYANTRLSDSEFLRILFENDILPDSIKINKGRVANSFEELDKQV